MARDIFVLPLVFGLLAPISIRPIYANTYESCAELVVAAQGVLDLSTMKIHVQHEGRTIQFYDTTRTISGLEYDAGPPMQRFLESARYPGAKVLDAGTSRGKLVFELRAEGVDAHGVDIALRSELAGLPHFRQADIRQMPYGDGEFKAVMCSFNVFHYGTSMKFRIEAMRELIRVTERGGRILLVGVTGLPQGGNDRTFGSFDRADRDRFASELANAFNGQVRLLETSLRGEGDALLFERL
jgi:hypothetical protein